ncbi:conjugal transfer protein TraF [Salinivibrio sp. ES.052]|uniref:conjugal transfer protein TraF n=1 Tax=Salinivibrio sp. ES.052 TaxID=1882823 RepID=UPI000926904F|nr:conjugal transfer protein TraF [Salinivibrio sp. ES.052]SIO31613.1 plasmid transfer operon, TraF, protein [Salinivibrio sp. ES.052]
MTFKTKALVLALAACSSSAMAATNPTDARGNAMGGVGVASGDYLSAGFHNPALAALDPDSAFGVLVPYLGAEVRDPDELVDGLDDVADAFDTNDTNQIEQSLRAVQGDKAYLDAGLGAAVGIPTGSVSATLYTSGLIEGAILPDIDTSDFGLTSNPNSNATIIAAGVGELGVALATNLELAGQRVAVGVTPKLQRITTYNYGVSVDEYDTDNWDDSRYREEENTFNLDLGAVWQSGPYRVGLAGKNLVSQDVDTVTSARTGHRFTYELEPQITLGSAFVSDFVTLAADLDLNKKKGFKGSLDVDDDTQFFRIGAEFDAFGHAQLRTGYRADLEDNVDNAFTLGLGLSPFGVANFDIAASIIDSNSYGGSAQLAFTF